MRIPYSLGLLAALALPLAACGSARSVSAPLPPAVAERAHDAGLLASVARARAAREATALALRAPRMAYPVLIPSGLDPAGPGAFVLDGATVDDDGDEVFYALRYRRADGACFAVSGSGGGEWLRVRRQDALHDSTVVVVRALHAPVVLYRAQERLAGPRGARWEVGDITSGAIEADGLVVTLTSRADDDAACRPVTLDEAAVLLAGLRPLDPADDLDGAYAPLDLTALPGAREGADSEALVRLVFAPPGSAGGTVLETVRRTDRRAVVLVTRRGTGGDAVSDEQVRAVLIHGDAGEWRLVSAGRRTRCQPGRGHADWSTATCL